MFGFVQPQYRACGECGASVPVSEEDTHECDRQSWLDYQMFQHRGGVAQLEVELGVWLETPHGRFAVFYAERQRRRVAEETIADVDASGRWPGKVVAEVTPAGPFWEAEPEHQDYLERYRHGYTCHFVRPEWVPTRRTQASAGSAKS